MFQLTNEPDVNRQFSDFVKQQIGPVDDESTLTLAREKQLWLDQLAQLYRFVDETLAEFIDQKQIQVTQRTVDLYEEQLGAYPAPALTIRIGRQIVELEPIGTFLIGARGRVNMNGPRGIARFVIVAKDASSPRWRVDVQSPAQALSAAPSPAAFKAEDWVWKISTPAPRINYIELTPESFQETLMGVIDG